LDTIAIAEGTVKYGNAIGYNVLVGGGVFSDYSDHPRIKVYIKGYNVYSTAAGRYQLLARYFDFYKKKLNLKDFSPSSQDKIALQQIKEQHALQDIDDGVFRSAVTKCSNIWASFPGAGYGQRELTYERLTEIFTACGGVLKDG